MNMNLIKMCLIKTNCGLFIKFDNERVKQSTLQANLR